MKEFLKNWYICIPFTEDTFSKILQELYEGISVKVNKNIIYSNSLARHIKCSDSPYTSAYKLDLHSEWLGEKTFWSILWIGIYPLICPFSGGETLLCNTVSVLTELPLEIQNLSFLFSFQGKISVYPLVLKHPIYGVPCLNFSLYWYNVETQKHDYISFPDIPNATWVMSMLYALIQKYTISVKIPLGYYLYFDNFLVLHGRKSFLWERKVERYSLYI